MKRTLLAFALTVFAVSLYAQNDSLVRPADSIRRGMVADPPPFPLLQPTVNAEVYKIKPAIDFPLTIAGVGWSLYAFSKIYNKDSSTMAQVLALNKNDISAFNRSAASEYSVKAFDASNVFFYGSMPLPLLFLLDNEVRKDAGKIALLYLEAMGVTGMLYTGSVFFKDKYRPYAYNPEAPMARRTRGGAKNSFFAGHVALVGTSTFFMAKVYNDYHPTSKMKYVFFGLAGAATAATGWLRYKAGEHFPTDVLIGMGVGTLSGILVPHFHKHKLIKNPNMSITPFTGSSTGLAMTYRF